MKCVLFLYTESDGKKAEELKDYLQTKLRAVADFKNITDILAEEQELEAELNNSHSVVLISSQKASSLIRNSRQETEDDFIIFDGGIIRQEFSRSRQLVDRLVIVYFTPRCSDDWIPDGFNERRIFHISGTIQVGNPSLDQLEDCIKGQLVPRENNRI